MTKKDVPADNPGLAKLPTKVRNRMGYKKKGGEVNTNSMGRGVNLANGGRIVYRATGNLAQDETSPIDVKHSEATIKENKDRMEDATKLGDGVSIRGGHINYIDDNDD